MTCHKVDKDVNEILHMHRTRIRFHNNDSDWKLHNIHLSWCRCTENYLIWGNEEFLILGILKKIHLIPTKFSKRIPVTSYNPFWQNTSHKKLHFYAPANI